MITNPTLSDNAVESGTGSKPIVSQGGGLYNNNSLVTLNNTIVANSPSGGDVAGASLLGSHNLIEDGSGGLADSLTGDPKLGPLADNGGPTLTMALLPGSPAIDAGDSGLVTNPPFPGPPFTDQRGFARISGAAVDIGAFEVQAPALSPATLPSGTYGTAYRQTITATPTVDAVGPFTFAITSATPPAWLTLDASTGVLGGTPTATGMLTFTITATASNGYTASQKYTLTIDRLAVTLTGSRAYDGTNTAAASILSVADLVSGDALTLSGGATLAGAGPGSEAITSVAGLTLGGASTSNYTLTGAAGSVTITPAATATTVSSSANPALPGQAVTFTATVTNTSDTAVTPAGTVQFTVDGADLGSAVPLSASGQAISPPVSFPTGTSHTVDAFYVDPAANFVASDNSLREIVLAQGVSVIGTTLYIIGGSTSSDTASVKPAGARTDGSTGLAVSATLGRVSSSQVFTQPIMAIVFVGYAGNDSFTLSSRLTLPATVTAGNGNDVIRLGGGANTVALGNGNDSVSAEGGNNTITVGKGNDVIQLGDGSNPVALGNGNDSASAEGGNNTITVGKGNDVIQLGDGSNVVVAGNGNDLVTAGGGTNSITVGNGNDILLLGDGSNTVALGNGSDLVTAGGGNNAITAGNGNDILRLGGGSNAVVLGNGSDLVTAGDGNDTVTVGNGNDVIRLGGGDNTVALGGGSDLVTAGGGNNTITVGNGNDVIRLGGGSNVVVEGNGNDSVAAGNGNNLIVGGLGRHPIRVGNGTNMLIDGSATVANAGDSFRQILNDWAASPVASNQAAIRSRFTVTYNKTYPNFLSAGAGVDWFFYQPPTTSNKKPSDFLN